MADFWAIIDKLIAILLALCDVLNIDHVEASSNYLYGSEFPETPAPPLTTTVPLSILPDSIRFPFLSRKVCQSAFCVSYADSVQMKMQPDAEPCDDFDRFACGGILQQADRNQSNTESTSSSHSSVSAQLRNRTFNRVKSVLESDDPLDSVAADKARRIYRACLDSESTDTAGVKSLSQILDDVLGGWPIITPGWNASAFDLYRSMASAKILGFDTVFKWTVKEHPANPYRNIIHLEQAVLGLESPKFYNEDATGDSSIRQAYRNLINSVGELLSAGNGTTDHNLDIRDLIDFEKALANETSSFASPSVKRLFAINSFIRQYESTSRLGKEFLNLLKTVLKSVHLDAAVSGASTIFIENVEFFSRLGNHLASVDRLGDDGKIILANYIGWNIIMARLPLLPASYRNALANFAKDVAVDADWMNGLPRWEECAFFVNDQMGNAVGNLYITKFIPQNAKTRVTAILSDIKTTAQQFIHDSAWINNPTKSVLLDKLQNVVDYTGYPDFIVDNVTALDAYYDEVTASDNHFDNVQSLTQFATHQQLKRINSGNRHDLDLDGVPVAVKANYFYNRNMIALFAGLFQPPYFDVDAPDYVNYAGIGYFYAYEIGRMFDDYAFQFNASGFPLASQSTPYVFRNLVDNLRSQYGDISIMSSQPGSTTNFLAENLAVKLVLMAYRLHHTVSDEPPLPNLSQFSSEMQLLLSFAQNWCSPTTNISDMADSNDFSANLRINTPLINLQDFTKIYHCYADSRMNSARKVVL